MLDRLPVLALTPGEPAGIGPDLCLQLAQNPIKAKLIVFADPELLQQRQVQLGLNVDLNIISLDQTFPDLKENTLNIFPIKLQEPTIAGQLNPANAAYVLETLSQAVIACTEGYCDAIVTAPVHKGNINDAGIAFTGHTEFLAEQTHANPVMMLACEGLRVALATTHLPLSQVSKAITAENLKQTIQIIHQDLINHFNISKPNIYVCGLNPHAGENGHLGREEIEVIEPTLEALRKEGINLIGPLSADTLFTPKYLEHADVVLAMYHDQGLPVLKHMGFGEAVNITLGLPIIRTSVDHGTALELAGTGKADATSLMMAINTAIEMINNSHP